MMHYLIQDRLAFAIEEYLGVWGSALASRFAVRKYEELLHTSELPAGVFIMSGVAQPGAAGRSLAAQVAPQLEKSPGVRVLNHRDADSAPPLRAMRHEEQTADRAQSRIMRVAKRFVRPVIRPAS